jgi:leucyl-tRNA synthetase
MKNDEYFIVSERAARNFAFQEMTVEDRKFPCLAKVTGQELVGMGLKAPLTSYEKVYVLPMTTVSMKKGTGIVTSVPSDSPDDWAALRDLQTKVGLREKFGVKEEWCVPFVPIPIIEIPELGNLAAVTLVDEFKVQSQKDTELLKKAKDKCYLKGFYEGKLLVGVAEGQLVEKAKPLVKKYMLEQNLAVPYYEPEGEIISRTGDTCIVATCYQWFMKYGEEGWKNQIKEHVLSDQFQTYNKKTQHEFELIIEWLEEWGCTRTQGLGTKLPWDEQFVIESLSDSTIYMAYYTVSHLLQGDLYGATQGPLGIKAEDLTDACWDYVYKKGSYPEGCAVPQESLDKMRHQFEYWYPMDMRVSAKDLIRNHLTMNLYNHAAIWEDKAMMPKSFYCNGYMVLNNEKMSKSSGNFLTMRDCINKFGVDATRITLADAGDGLDDANFETDVANASILKLFTLETWIKEKIKAAIPDGSIDFATHKANFDLWDNIFENGINYAIVNATQNFDEIKYKQVLKFAFFELLSIKEDYLIAKGGKVNPFVLMRFIVAQLVILNPIIPHFTQYCWNEYVYPVLAKSQNFGDFKENLCDQAWPQPSGTHDKITSDRLAYLKDVKGSIRQGLEKAKQGGKKPKKGAVAEPVADLTKCSVLVAKEYPEFQKKCLEIL